MRSAIPAAGATAPFGTSLVAVDALTDIARQTTLGITEGRPPDKQKTGRPNTGGSPATAGGLVFIGATDDHRFRAFDSKVIAYALP